jgi:hypothetical protein
MIYRLFFKRVKLWKATSCTSSHFKLLIKYALAFAFLFLGIFLIAQTTSTLLRVLFNARRPNSYYENKNILIEEYSSIINRISKNNSIKRSKTRKITPTDFSLVHQRHESRPNATTIIANIENNKEIISLQKCNPILTNRAQFSVVIDHVRYPAMNVPLYHNTSLNFTCLNSTSNVKTILLWTRTSTRPFNIPLHYGIGHQFRHSNCPVTNCEFTNNRHVLNRSHLVLFYIDNNVRWLPTARTSATQRFVHVTYDPPGVCHMCEKFDDTVFNYSASYAHDISDYSSIYWTDSGIYWQLNESFNASVDRSANKKSGRAAVLMFDCESGQGTDRLRYIQELNKTFQVEVFGSCGRGAAKCPVDLDCKDFIAKNFKFYLSFESSACKGYITDEFFHWLNFDIVHVVLGLGDYDYYVPKSGYVSAMDFKSPRELGAYLSVLDRNPTAYNEFFKWKKYISTEYFTGQKKTLGFLCEMCIQLQLEEMLGYAKQRQLTDLTNKFGVLGNCGHGQVAENGTAYSIKTRI